jgi:hypothetical protein
MSEADDIPAPPTESEIMENGAKPAPGAVLDLKLKIVLGSNFSVELARNRLADLSPEVVALLASKYVISMI